MSKRVLVSILLIPSIVVLLGVLTRPCEVLNFILGPVDDPQYFCSGPDPSPLPEFSSSTVLQECSAGKTVTIGRGQTIAVDLLNSACVDFTTRWRDFSVSNESVLETALAPTSRGGACDRWDEIAIYRAVGRGQSSISAVQTVCGWQGCGRSHRWTVTVKVS